MSPALTSDELARSVATIEDRMALPPGWGIAMIRGVAARWPGRAVMFSSGAGLRLVDRVEETGVLLARAARLADRNPKMIPDVERAAKLFSGAIELLERQLPKHLGRWRRRLSGEVACS